MATKKKESVVFEYGGQTFDSGNGELSLGDMEQLENNDVYLSKLDKNIAMRELRPIATMCLSRASGHDVGEDFVKSIPASKLRELTDFVTSFFGRNFPGQGKKAS